MLLKSSGSSFDIDASSPEAPSPPESLKEAGLTLTFLNDLILKALYLRGTMVGRDLGQFFCLPFKVVKEALKFLKDEKNIEVMGGDLVGEVSYRFSLTDLGRRRAQEAMTMCSYCGPAPVPIEDYVEQTYRQAVTGIRCTPESLAGPFSHLIIRDEMFNALGPAIVSGRSVFIYGPPGNGKTAMARSIGEFMNQAGGAIYVPHAFMAEGSVITVFDPSLHQVDENIDNSFIDPESSVKRLLNSSAIDPRWVRIRRPVIITGGELTLDMMDLRYNAESKFYQAPIHFKANGGVFLIDDFGRQIVSPKELLNRWILPLEDRHDFLTVASGTIDILPNLATATTFDFRSHARTMLDAIEAAFEGKASSTQLSYSINGRTVEHLTPEQLITWRSFYKMEVTKEAQAEKFARTGINPRRIGVRFHRV